MGADGGICWVALRDREVWRHLMGWASWRALNPHAWSYKVADIPETPASIAAYEDYLEGGYGTDCDFSLREIIEMAESLQSSKEGDSWTEHLRGHTFEELWLDILTAPPGFDLSAYDYGLRRLVDLLKDCWHLPDPGSEESPVPEHLRSMTVGEWADALLCKAIYADTFDYEETWT